MDNSEMDAVLARILDAQEARQRDQDKLIFDQRITLKGVETRLKSVDESNRRIEKRLEFVLGHIDTRIKDTNSRIDRVEKRVDDLEISRKVQDERLDNLKQIAMAGMGLAGTRLTWLVTKLLGLI